MSEEKQLDTAKAFTKLSHELHKYEAIIKEKRFEKNRLRQRLHFHVNEAEPIQKYQVGDNEVLVVEYVTSEYAHIYFDALEGAERLEKAAPKE